MNQSSTKQTNNMKTANNPTCVLPYTRARAHARTPLRTFACAWTLFLAIVIGAGNVAWGQYTETTDPHGFTYSSTQTTQSSGVPNGTYKVVIECLGAGGSGGNANKAYSAAGGGGGGGYGKSEFILDKNTTIQPITTSFNVIVGKGGTGGLATNGPGGDSYVKIGTGDPLAKGGGGAVGTGNSSRESGKAGGDYSSQSNIGSAGTLKGGNGGDSFIFKQHPL